MSVDFKKLLHELRALIVTLEERCTASESYNAELLQQVEQQQKRIEALEAEKTRLESNYRDLQSGMALGSAHSEEEIKMLKDRFLGMVHEIDDCIAKLNG